MIFVMGSWDECSGSFLGGESEMGVARRFGVSVIIVEGVDTCEAFHLFLWAMEKIGAFDTRGLF